VEKGYDMKIKKVNFQEKADLIKELHAYKVIAQMNNYYFKLVKAKRDFVWHQHPETDEVFVGIQGKFKVATREKVFEIFEGEMIVVPKGVEHKPICDEECCVMLIEPKETVNTGNAGGALTDTKLEWI
jgi:mannose-6-phosphate isomerase-like protein (cupin superfamily)